MIAEFPYRSALGMNIDCGRFAANLDDALAQARDAGFRGAARGCRKRAAGCAGSGSAAFSRPRAARLTKAPKSASIPMAGFR